MNAVLLLVAAALSYYLFELPLMTLGRKMARSLSAARRPTAGLVDLEA
jgi:peptidoglycan/LPS O-acetylase OafA/YrhL